MCLLNCQFTNFLFGCLPTGLPSFTYYLQCISVGHKHPPECVVHFPLSNLLTDCLTILSSSLTVVDCGDPGAVAYAKRVGNSFAFEQTVQFQCNKGFEMTGAERLSCLSNATWSSPLPSCQPVKCPKLTAPPYANLSKKNFTYLGIVLFECLPGFYLIGSSHLQCTADRNWNSSTPSCLPVQCPQLGLPPHSRLVKENISYQGETVHHCLPGYKVAGGDQARVCQKDGQWLGQPLYCQGVFSNFCLSEQIFAILGCSRGRLNSNFEEIVRDKTFFYFLVHLCVFVC